MAIVVGFTLVAAVVVRGTLVDPDFYLAALDENDAYERTYTEVLADPEFAAVAEQLIGELGFTPGTSRSVRVVSTHALRWSLPPADLRSAVESFVEQVLSYVRGEQGELSGDVDVTVVLARILESVLAQFGARIAEAAEVVATTAVEYEDALASFAGQLANGVVPSSIPVFGGTEFDPERVVDLILDELGDRADDRLRQQIRAAILGGSQREALVAAGSAFVAEHAQRISDELRSDAVYQRYVDIVAQLAGRSGVDEEEISDQLGTIRAAAWWLRAPTAVLGGLLLLGAAAQLWWSNRSNLARAGWVTGTAGVLAGGAVAATWGVVQAVVAPPLGPATTTGEGSWNLPFRLRRLIADVETSLADGLDDVVGRLVLTPIVVGLVVGAVTVGLPQLARLRRRQLALLAGGAAAAGSAAVWLLPSGPGITPDRACNGHVELCDRPYDQVVNAATHNAMSSPDVVYLWPEQDLDLRGQLDSGVRALLIDTHYWTPLQSGSQLSGSDAPLPAPLADRLVGFLEERRDPRGGVYLCHNHCALGARSLSVGLRQVRVFLEENPHEVVTLIVQDETRRRDTVQGFIDAELEDHLYAHTLGEPWPTLGELIDAGRRLVVFSENHGPQPDWYHDAFEHIQETPYRVQSPDDFDCRPNRGPRDAPLFLLNHWVHRDAPDRAMAAVVNRREFIVDRARQCELRRGQLPNFLAVNFSTIGDVLGAVDTLNGLPRRSVR